MKYFSCDSNMALKRLQEILSSLVRVGAFTLKEHQLHFQMTSNDGSGKYDVFQINNKEENCV